ncbi:hypothetical protein TNCV_1366671 [Trichonephila clavipes]|nr:hypothetical protein TNCV_1366671 [Trichonephila clavipes]
MQPKAKQSSRRRIKVKAELKLELVKVEQKLLEREAARERTREVREQALPSENDQVGKPIDENSACVEVGKPIDENSACVEVGKPIDENPACVEVGTNSV